MSLKLRKLDLHVHTPASHDFVNKTVTAEQIIEHAQSLGLDAIGVTDHNTVDFIDEIKTAAKKRKFTIFPGVEVSCGGSLNGSIHVIGLFDPAVTKDDLQKVLGSLEIRGKGESALTNKSVSDVIDIIKKNGGLPVLAHANSTHGALSDIKGNPRTEVIKNLNLCAVEATVADFSKESGKRLLDILNGRDSVYKRKLAVYKSSDNRSIDGAGHCVESIGSQFTFFKMGDLTLESLRQCFDDPDSRIIQDYESEKISSEHARIESIAITGGFLDKQKIIFHAGMNSIIGGTGTGKSLIIEFLRFVFDRKPHSSLLSDHKEKLNKQLRLNGEVRVTFRDSSGDSYTIFRKLESSRDPYSSKITCINNTSGKEFKGDVSSVFPILLYSQNEILEITRDSSAQLRLLDNFRDFATYQNQIAEICQTLEKLDGDLIQAINGSANHVELTKQLENVDEKIKKLDKKLGAKNLKVKDGDFISLSSAKTGAEANLEEFDLLNERVDEIITELEENISDIKQPKNITETIEVSINKVHKDVIKLLQKAKDQIEEAKIQSEKAIKSWEQKVNYKSVEKQYNAEITKKKADQLLEGERRGLLKEKGEITQKIARAEKAAKQYSKIRSDRETLLSRLSSIKKSYFEERKTQAEAITAKSGSRLKINVQPGEDTKIYLQLLTKVKVGSHAEKREVEVIAKSIPPRELVNMVLDKNIKQLAHKAKFTEIKAENIIKELSSKENIVQTLALQYKGFPEDKIEILYQKKDIKHYPLSELSMGQKADALIMIALGDGQMPVIIDQPEDALDIPSIWSDICTRLRISKHVRQFIFTTHNSSICVSSDSDQFVILAANGSSGWIEHTGSIDTKNIKDGVVGHLEGGYDSYELKRKKYGLYQ